VEIVVVENKIKFEGLTWFETESGYYKRRGKGQVFLHRTVWENANGPIPVGFAVRHKDGNRENNTPGNLEINPRTPKALQYYADIKRRKKRELLEELEAVDRDIRAYEALARASGADLV